MTRSATDQVRQRLIQAGGKTAQDLGLGRIVGQILLYLYLSEAERSLDEMAEELGLSKAAVSIAARQLENLGLIRRVWKRGDRRGYYRSADDIATALHQGLLTLVRSRLAALAEELQTAEDALQPHEKDAGAAFLLARVQRAQKLRGTAMKVLESPLVRVFTGVR